MYRLQTHGTTLHLSPERALYAEAEGALLLADVHLGKSETFQQAGIPIPSQVNRSTLERLQRLCQQFQPQHIWILGDMFHARAGVGEEVLAAWAEAMGAIARPVHLILGNHDRALIPLLEPFGLQPETHPVDVGALLLSHEPVAQSAQSSHANQPSHLNICGHIHPCLRLRTKLDSLRLPCFFWERQQARLTLPSFGEFTGGYEVQPTADTVAYAIAEDSVIPFEGAPQTKAHGRSPRRLRSK